MTLEDLLQPLSGASPGGSSLLHEPEFDAIEAARREDDPTLPRGVWTAELKRADWPEVARLCRTVLATRSKDLQVAAWLGEAWIALDGIAGGIRATRLATGLSERFWDTLHPLPRDGDLEFRTAPLAWLDEHWSRALLVRVPLLNSGSKGDGAFAVTLAQWREALAAENAERKAGKDKKPAAGAAPAAPVTRASILIQVRGAELAALAATAAALQEWAAALAQLHATLEARLPGTAPPLHRLRALLGEAEGVVAGWIGERPDGPVQGAPALAAAAAAPTQPPEPDAQVAAPVAAADPIPAAISSRADAYARLRQIADYLAHLEPHSPVPLLLRRAVDWGGLPFEKLINELSHNNNEMQKVLLRDAIG